MRAKTVVPISLLLIAGSIISCGSASHGAAEKVTTPNTPAPFASVAKNRYVDDVGRFLGGLPGTEGSPFKEQEADEAWKLHASALNTSWHDVEAKRLPPMREFYKTELSGKPVDSSVMFYPFSGPDVLTPSVFFPNNQTYVFVAMEPAGTLPTKKELARKFSGAQLAQVRETLGDVMQRSFFITRQMDKQFRGQVSDGLLPAILVLLARTQHTVLGMRYVRIDDNGRLVERASDYRAPGRIGNKGVEIDFQTDADKSAHKLFYFSVNLDDAHLAENKQFQTYLASLGDVTTFFKSTSYMLHRPEFSKIREIVTQKSATVLQDDSGIPFKYFEPARWNVQLYGDYDKPYGSFRYLQQLDLKKAYADGGAKQIGFRIGYGYSKAPSNLLLAKRKQLN